MNTQNHYDIIFIGSGASALMCAANLLKNLKILLIDANSQIGQKILISGGGKCNIVNENLNFQDYIGDKEFLDILFKNYSYKDILGFFDGVEFEKRKGGKFFTKSGAQNVVNFLAQKTSHCHFALNHKCQKVAKNGSNFEVFTDKKTFTCKSLVVASGGLSYPKLNSSSIGYEIAEHFGHKIAKTSPALVGLSVQKEQFWFRDLSGISLRAKISVEGRVFEDDILFSHRGLSGLGVLNASLFWQKGKLSLDFLPQKNVKSFLTSKHKQITSLLPLPKRFVKAFLLHVSLYDKKIKDLSKDEFEKLQSIHAYEFAPAGTFGYSKAEVTKGGVSLEEIDPQTYESKRVKNLFFLGEVLDITGRLGGYNFYFAFASALKMAKRFSQ